MQCDIELGECMDDYFMAEWDYAAASGVMEGAYEDEPAMRLVNVGQDDTFVLYLNPGRSHKPAGASAGEPQAVDMRRAFSHDDFHFDKVRARVRARPFGLATVGCLTRAAATPSRRRAVTPLPPPSLPAQVPIREFLHYVDVDARDAAHFERAALLRRRGHPPVVMEKLGANLDEEDEEDNMGGEEVEPPAKYERYEAHHPKEGTGAEGDASDDEEDDDDVSLVHVACLGDGKPQTHLPQRAPAHEMYINKFPLSHYSSLLAPYRREHRNQVRAVAVVCCCLLLPLLLLAVGRTVRWCCWLPREVAAMALIFSRPSHAPANLSFSRVSPPPPPPKVLTADSLMVALAVAQRFDSPHIRLGFNSLGAGASVNHMHFQLWEYPLALPCEEAHVFSLVHAEEDEGEGANEPHAAFVARYSDTFPVKFVRFDFAGVPLRRISQSITQASNVLINRNVPFNLVISSTTVFLFPRRPLYPLGTIRFGFPEVAGQLIVASKSEFENLTDDDIDAHLERFVDSKDEDFEALLDALRDLA